LLAWIRTSASLFSFGFAISKFFTYLEGQENVQFSAGPRRLGLVLVCLGVLVLVPAVIEHARRLRRMKELGLPTVSWFSLPNATALGVIAIGVAVLVGLWLEGPL
jgi:putative membrane protein